MDIQDYIRGNSSALYMILSYKKLYLVTDNFHRVFFLNKTDLKKVENHSSEIIKDTYQLSLNILNNKDNKELRDSLEKSMLYKDFRKFVKEELSEDLK